MLRTCAASLGMHLLEIEITTRCNLNCAHCYNRGQEMADLPLQKIIDLISFAERHRVDTVVISGGEAVLHPDFDILCRYLLETKLMARVFVQSNGYIGKKDVTTLRGFNTVHLSFEPEETGIREISVKDIINLTIRLRDVGIYSYLFATVHSKNIDKIDWMVEVANRSGIDIGFNLCLTREVSQDLKLSVEEMKRVTEKLHQHFLNGKILRFSSPLVSVLRGQKTEKYSGIKGGCTAGVAACVVLPNGDVAPCPFFRIKAGNIYESDLEKIWFESEILNSLRHREAFDEPCGSCEHLSYCGGCRNRAFENTGRFNGCDPGCFKDVIL